MYYLKIRTESVCKSTALYCFFFDVFVSKPKEELDDASSTDEPGDETSSFTELQDPDKYKEVFRARNQLGNVQMNVFDSLINVSEIYCLF